MNNLKLIILSLIIVLISSCSYNDLQVSSPNGQIKLNVEKIDNKIYYSVLNNGLEIVKKSSLGFILDEEISNFNQFKILNHKISNHNEPWKMVWGERDSVENIYTQCRIYLQDILDENRKVSIVFKVYDDGIGFRYEFDKWRDQLIVNEELTEFNLNSSDTCWWIPADYDCYEHLYSKTLIKDIDASDYLDNGLAASTIKNVKAVSTPVTIKNTDGIYLSIHEANLTNFAGMTLALNENSDGFISELVPSPNGYKAKVDLPFKTPWRTIQISENAGGLIESSLIVNLNEPNKIKDVSWITPMKYIGIWWGMHVNKYSWGLTEKHGATTQNAKDYIDFASKYDIGGVLIEGWNTGWEDWIGDDREGIFDFVTPYPDFDIYEVTTYAESKGVEIIGHHETSAAVTTYEQQIDTAFKFYKNLGIDAIKTGYVGKIYPKGEYHHGQWMVNHYRRVVEKAAEEKIMIDAHEPIKPTGIRRTYPNMMTREGMRGQEFNAWTAGNPPEHLVELPFTRMLAGPLDYTPGIFDIEFNQYKPDNRVHNTIANQLALFVVLYSPLQMAADLIENYENNPAFEFIDRVPVNWNETKVIDAEIGDYIIIARRNGSDWYLAAITDENPRQFEIDLSFIGNCNSMKIFADGAETSFYENPTAINIDEYSIKKDDKLIVSITSGGGFAGIISNSDIELKSIEEYNKQAVSNFEIFKKQRKYGE